MLDNFFNGCAHAHSLGIATQIKNMGEPMLEFAGIYFNINLIIFGCRTVQYCFIKEEEFEDLED
jgi:hypothetical protein